MTIRANVGGTKPNAGLAARTHAAPADQLVVPRIPDHLFPITSQEDLVTKLLGASSSRSVTESSETEALPSSLDPGHTDG